ncbi:MAG: VPLPA-CTERM sorting domain-containing protein [Pseudooceanicola nanhaiensis]
MFGFVKPALVALLVSGGAASAATVLTLDASGKLTGAQNVDVNGTLYNVSFSGEGTCATNFSGCDELSDFAFTDQASAAAAGQALLNDVFVLGFDSAPEDTLGCDDWLECLAYIPFALPESSGTDAVIALNSTQEWDDRVGLAYMGNSTDFSIYGNVVWANFTPAAEIPLPAGAPLLIAALGGLAVLRRRRMR